MSKSQFDCRTSPQDEMEIGEGRLKIEIFYTECLLPRWFDWFYFRMFAFKIFSQRFNWLCFYYTFWTNLFVVDSRHCFLILHDRCDKWWSLLVTSCSLVIVLASDGLRAEQFCEDRGPRNPWGLGTSWGRILTSCRGYAGDYDLNQVSPLRRSSANAWGLFCQV